MSCIRQVISEVRRRSLWHVHDVYLGASFAVLDDLRRSVGAVPRNTMRWVRVIPMLFSFLLSQGCEATNGGEDRRSGPSGGVLFVDVTDDRRLSFVHEPGVDSSYFMPEMNGSGGAFLDYDNDGDLDIYLVNGARRGRVQADEPPARNRLFRQEPDGRFVDVTEPSGLGDTGYGQGVAVGDIDNDGDVDVYVTNYGPDALYRNNGDGTFTNISQGAGVRNPEWGTSVIFFDFDLDGFLDIYVANYLAFNPAVICTDQAGRTDYCGPASFPGVPDVLYRNNGDGTFSDVSVASGIAAGSSKGMGVVSADFSGDVYPDVYVANDGVPNHLWISVGDGTFQDLALPLGAAVNALGKSEAGMGIAISDIDEDGDFDLFVTHLGGESNTFYRNAGAEAFQDATSPAGLGGPSIPYTGIGTGFVDYDHDGDLDLALVNGRVIRGPLLTDRRPPSYWDPYAEPNLFFENDGGGRFRDVGDRMPVFSRALENSRGLAFGDVDNDGDLDFLVTNVGGRARLIESRGSKGHWLMVRAVDLRLRRDAIGASITVVAGDKRYTRLIAPGYSFQCSNDPRAHFGLASATAVDRILVRWPDGEEEVFPGVEADQIITLKKGQAPLNDG